MTIAATSDIFKGIRPKNSALHPSLGGNNSKKRRVRPPEMGAKKDPGAFGVYCLRFICQ